MTFRHAGTANLRLPASPGCRQSHGNTRTRKQAPEKRRRTEWGGGQVVARGRQRFRRCSHRADAAAARRPRHREEQPAGRLWPGAGHGGEARPRPRHGGLGGDVRNHDPRDARCRPPVSLQFAPALVVRRRLALPDAGRVLLRPDGHDAPRRARLGRHRLSRLSPSPEERLRRRDLRDRRGRLPVALLRDRPRDAGEPGPRRDRLGHHSVAGLAGYAPAPIGSLPVALLCICRLFASLVRLGTGARPDER